MRAPSFRAGLLLIALGGPSALAGESREPMLVVIRSSAPVKGAFVRLREIADLPNDPHRLREFAGEILLGFSPEPGALREIGAQDVATRLREAGLAPERFIVKGAPRSVVFKDDGAKGESGGPPLLEGKEERGDARGPAAEGTPQAKWGSNRAGTRSAKEPARREEPRPAPPAKGSAGAKAGGTAGAPDGRDRGVEKGDTLVLRSSGQTLFLEEPVRVIGRDPSGERIEVQNIRTGKKFLARLLDRGVAVRADDAGMTEGGE